MEEKRIREGMEMGFTCSWNSYVPTRLPLLMTRMEPTVLSGPWEEVRLASSQPTLKTTQIRDFVSANTKPPQNL